MAFRQAKLKSVNPAMSTATHPHVIQANIPPTNNNRSGTVGYAPDAAWYAIRRHMQIGLFDEQIVRDNFLLDLSISQ